MLYYNRWDKYWSTEKYWRRPNFLVKFWGDAFFEFDSLQNKIFEFQA